MYMPSAMGKGGMPNMPMNPQMMGMDPWARQCPTCTCRVPWAREACQTYRWTHRWWEWMPWARECPTWTCRVPWAREECQTCPWTHRWWEWVPWARECPTWTCRLPWARGGMPNISMNPQMMGMDAMGKGMPNMNSRVPWAREACQCLWDQPDERDRCKWCVWWCHQAGSGVWHYDLYDDLIIIFWGYDSVGIKNKAPLETMNLWFECFSFLQQTDHWRCFCGWQIWLWSIQWHPFQVWFHPFLMPHFLLKHWFFFGMLLFLEGEHSITFNHCFSFLGNSVWTWHHGGSLKSLSPGWFPILPLSHWVVWAVTKKWCLPFSILNDASTNDTDADDGTRRDGATQHVIMESEA